VSAGLAVAFTEGTHRVAAPPETLARVAPLCAAMGITRLADITGLDRLGVPTWCAVRPTAATLQIANGKGISHAAARISAVMEAIELWHAEHPGGEFRRASTEELERDGAAFAPISSLPNYWPMPHVTDRRRLNWVRGESLADGTPVWLPACAAFLVQPMLLAWSTNGLASGNHPVEATLHALYEVIERDAMTRLARGGLSLPRGNSRVVDLDTLPAGPVLALRDQLERAGVAITLVRVDGIAPVTTFWAALVDPKAPLACSHVNIGSGSHLSPAVAAIRAITEAAQSRLTLIHGAREDLSAESYRFSEAHAQLRAFFQKQRGDLAWSAIADLSSGDLLQDLALVLAGLQAAGHGQVYRVDLTNRQFGIPVVKVLVPGLAFIGGFMARHTGH
jgi:ribosomal protein S12 methylthiotransferase accessory factor